MYSIKRAFNFIVLQIIYISEDIVEDIILDAVNNNEWQFSRM